MKTQELIDLKARLHTATKIDDTKTTLIDLMVAIKDNPSCIYINNSPNSKEVVVTKSQKDTYFNFVADSSIIRCLIEGILKILEECIEAKQKEYEEV